MKLAVSIAALVLCPRLWGQPKILAVTSAASTEIGVAPDGYGTIFGSGLADAQYSAASFPLPKKLGSTEVLNCPNPKVEDSCLPVEISYAGPTQVNFRLGPATSSISIYQRFLAVRVNGVLDSDASGGKSTTVWLRQYAPAIFLEGSDCYIDTRYKDANVNCGLNVVAPKTNHADRGAVIDLQGKLLTSANPAKLGGIYTVWLTGLSSRIKAPIPTMTLLTVSNVPVYGYPGDTFLLVSPDYLGESSQYPGLYQLNFVLPKEVATGSRTFGYPPMWPCGDYKWELSIYLVEGNSAQETSNLVQIPVIVKNGDVECVQ